MHIKISHTHSKEGRTCYDIDPGRGCTNFSEVHLLTLVNHGTLRGTKVAMGYKPYTGCYYMFDVRTGEELGTLKKGPLVEYFKALITGELNLHDSECLQTP
jgi:hypothetical protein